MHVQTPGRLHGLRHLLMAAVFLCGLGGFVGTAHAGNAALVLDASTGEVITAVNPDELNHPASLTKMMTLYLTFQALEAGRLKLDDQLPISSHAANKAPSKLGLRAGRTISVKDCVLGMITKSANDAATVVAEKLGGSESQFVEMMNVQGLLLGMTRTRFGSASGLPNPNDATTARDMSKLALALYRDFPAQVPYFAIREFTFQGRTVRGHNRLMDRYPGMDGLKTGYTNAAGFNLASTAVHDGRRLFGVVLGGRTSAARDNLMARLLDDGFAHQQTSPALVAAAGRGDRAGARRLLSALSPISTAEAAPVVKKAHTARKAKSSRQTRLASSKTSKTAAATCRKASSESATTCVRRAHTPKSQARTKLAKSTAKKPAAAQARRD